MRHHRSLALSSALAIAVAGLSPSLAHAAAAGASASSDEIVVTARKRTESLLDVPVAVTAISGDVLEARGINSVKDAAALSPGLTITSDGSGRAFVAIRGVGVTLVQSVQPGVGLFIDGVYQPNTAYLNNPLLDVERIEVLRGPQGTLYGKNTLGGAIDVITRQPGNELRVRAGAGYAGPDNAWQVSGSVSAPLVKDGLSIRVAGSHQQQDGFLTNSVIGGNANTLKKDSINATLRATPGSDVVITLNGYYDWINGVNTPYSRVASPQDYRRDVPFNALNKVTFHYRGVNLKLEAPIAALDTKLTLIGAYDARSGRAPDNDADFGPFDIARSTGNDELRTRTVELRLDSKLSSSLSTLVGLFYSRETTVAHDITRIIPLGLTRNTDNNTKADTYAAFGTVFWKPSPTWEVAAGLRYDHESRQADGSVVIVGLGGGPLPTAQIKSNNVEPRFTVTYHASNQLSVYGSVARGYRGGGFNAPTAPTRTYRGDSAWTYELGTKYASADRRIWLAADVFYNDYSHYIGLNSIAPAAGGGLVTVDLNTGHVSSYGLELEARVRPVPAWSINGSMTLMHARITDPSEYIAITGRTLSSDRLTFQPDWMANISTDYTFELGHDQRLTFGAGLTGKGKRLAATLNQTTPTLLDGYWLANASATYHVGPLEVTAFADNLFNKDYWESYIEKTTLQLAGLPASDLGITGDQRRYGVRLGVKF